MQVTNNKRSITINELPGKTKVTAVIKVPFGWKNIDIPHFAIVTDELHVSLLHDILIGKNNDWKLKSDPAGIRIKHKAHDTNTESWIWLERELEAKETIIKTLKTKKMFGKLYISLTCNYGFDIYKESTYDDNLTEKLIKDIRTGVHTDYELSECAKYRSGCDCKYLTLKIYYIVNDIRTRKTLIFVNDCGASDDCSIL